MDWNTFFSSVAQKSSALIGVVLAFVISRIFNESVDYDEVERQQQALLISLGELKIKADRINFEWHDARLWEHYSGRINFVKNPKIHGLSDTEVIREIKNELPRIYNPENVLESVKKEITSFTAKATRGPFSDPYTDYACMQSIVTPELWSNIRNVELEFNDIELRTSIELKKLKSHVKSIKNNIQDFVVLKK